MTLRRTATHLRDRDRRRGRKLTGRCQDCGRKCAAGDVCRYCEPAAVDDLPAIEELPEPNDKAIEMHSSLSRDEKAELAGKALMRLIYLPLGEGEDPFTDEIQRRFFFWCGSCLTDATEGIVIAQQAWDDAVDAYEENEDGFIRRARRTDWIIAGYDDPLFRAMSTMI